MSKDVCMYVCMIKNTCIDSIVFLYVEYLSLIKIQQQSPINIYNFYTPLSPIGHNLLLVILSWQPENFCIQIDSQQHCKI